MRELWQAVGAVRLVNQTTVAVDMRWLSKDLPDDLAGLQERQRQVQALLDYHKSPGVSAAGADTGGALAALDRVLQDPRFRYPDVTPTPVPPEPDRQPALVAPESGPFVLAIAGVIVVVVALFFLAQALTVQRTADAEALDDDDDPATSDAARDLAVRSEASQDYRAAIRYLYLSSLLTLDERGLIRYDRTLTNREHLRQVADNPPLFDLLRPIVNVFDRVWYGFAPVDAALYQDFRRNVERLTQLEP